MTKAQCGIVSDWRTHMKCVVFPYYYDPPAKSWQLGALACAPAGVESIFGTVPSPFMQNQRV